MNKTIFASLVLFFCLSSSLIIAQDNNFVYFPAHIGDTWEWYSYIEDTTYSNSITYIFKKFDNSTDVYLNNSENPRFNIKSNGNVYQYFGSKLEIWYDFTVAPGDTFYTTIYSSQYYVIVDSSEGEIFGELTKFRRFTWEHVDNTYQRSVQWLSDKFGLYSTNSFLGPLSAYVIGCKINGKTYGTLVSVENRENKIPDQFVLKQNYPNPFNPSTTIRYQLPEESFVKINIYNLLGQKIKTLVNANMKAGTYNTVWYGKNDYGGTVASGIYVYRIVTDKNIISKKMTLMK